jgi:hypothetical protein
LVQTLVQLPQALVVFKLASQPFATLPSQLPQPALQVIEQAPSVQEALPFTPLQALPQVPQLEMLVCVLVSHPFELMPSQLPQPALHVPSAQVPLAHDSLAFARSQL